MEETSLSDVVYDYYSSKIQFGFYQYGEVLPSISQICHQFQVGATTVRAALTRMKMEGYISTSERKATCIIYQPKKGDDKKCAVDFFARKEGMEDLCRFS